MLLSRLSSTCNGVQEPRRPRCWHTGSRLTGSLLNSRTAARPSAASVSHTQLHARGRNWKVLRLNVAVHSVATESITGRPLVVDSYDETAFEPSNDLRELAAAQLQSLFQVLRRVSPGASSSCKACVYARRADSLDGPQIRLQRVACCKSAQAQLPPTLGYTSSSPNPGGHNSFEELDEVLTLHRAAWEPGSRASSGCETEALLINEEIVLLPSSNLLVLPLAEAGMLVGLLVVEVRAQPGSPVPHQPQPLQPDIQQQQQMGGQPVWELPPVLGLSEDVLWALRTCVPPLSKACTMDLRTALSGAQQEARQRLARSLLLEARGPLKVLGTFGQMLSPRLRTGQTGEPESDMADGMLLQGQRLADVVAQLEAALRPNPRVVGVSGFSSSEGAADFTNSSSSSSSWNAVQQPWSEPLVLPAAAAAAVDDGNLSDEDDSWAFDDRADLQQQHQAATSSSRSSTSSSHTPPVSQHSTRVASTQPHGVLQQPTSSTPSSAARPRLVSPVVIQVAAPAAPHQPQQGVDLVPGHHTGESLESSSRDIRWRDPGIARPAATTLSSSGRGGGSCSSLYAPATSTFDAARTIDLEPQASSDSSVDVVGAQALHSMTVGASSAEAARQGKKAQLKVLAAAGGSLQESRQQQQKRPTSKGVCNVAEVLNHLLAAAAKLAHIQGVNLIVNDPLSLEQPHADISSSTDSSAASASSSSSTALTLLPRPVRPLLVSVAGNVCRRVLGYCVDVALQCTPRGGQLCVTARASSGGVEVSLMHTGQAQPSRLHTSSAAMDAAALGAPAPPSSQEAAQVPAAAGRGAALAPRQQKRQRRMSSGGSTAGSGSATSMRSSTGSSSSSSSSWSMGLQELSSGAGIRGGSSLITLDFARQVLGSIGGRLNLTYPYHFMNAMTGQLEQGTNIEVWLPAPTPTAG